jgi:hypothetical protein
MFYVGIDPGKQGAIVCINRKDEIVFKSKTPLIVSGTVKGEKLGRDEYDIVEMKNLLISLKRDSAGILAVLEKAQPMPAKMGGGIANFGRGLSFGLWQGLLVALDIPYIVAPPKTWQGVMFAGVNKDDTKQASVVVAQRRWPNVDWKRTAACKNADDGLTDAALLALFGSMTAR